MLGCIALHSVREADLTLLERAVVIGLGLLGPFTVQFQTTQGFRVVGVDLDWPKWAGFGTGADLGLVPGEENVEETRVP